jgi:hypothetical protein|nr:MAG TPA: tail tube protein [Caudoviricetes sp.]
MAANGRVITGFSKPYVAIYSASGTSVTYTGVCPLARGVSVDTEVEVGDDNNFYADNMMAETAPGLFMGGTTTLEVDGLKLDAEKMIMGLGGAEQVTVGDKQVDITNYNDNMQIPYVGIGFIVRWQSDNTVTYEPRVYTKARFAQTGLSAATQEEEIDWQPTTLEAALMRDDSAAHNWQRVGAEQASEADAEAVILALLGGNA